MTKWHNWTPAELAEANLADLLELQEYRAKAKKELAFLDAIYDSAMATQFKANKFGRSHIAQGEYTVHVDKPKRIKWADGLADHYGKIEGVRAKYDMTETAFNALDGQEKATIRLYRQEEVGKVNYVIEKDSKNDQH